MESDLPGIVYLLHFSEPFRHSRHYLGWTNDLEKRLESHRNGSRERCVLTWEARQRGITFTVARTWEGPISKEKELKRLKNNPKLCPFCNESLEIDVSTLLL